MLNCHCRDCQRSSGGPFSSFVVVPTEAFKLTKGELRFHASPSEMGGMTRRGFCAECGSPVSGKPGVMDYTVRFDAGMIGKEYDFVLTVKCNVTTLCPCSKAISKYGAHNQRGEVTVHVRTREIFWIEDLISLIEASGSSEMYSLLKREDEKAA